MGKKVVAIAAVAAVAVLAVAYVLWLRSCPEPSIIYVYANDAQKNAMDGVTSTFKTVLLNYYGVNVINVPVCPLPAQSIPAKLRVYPALLVKGSIPSLYQLITGYAGGYGVISPLISAVLTRYQGVNVTFGVAAEAVILESTAPFVGFNMSERNLKEILSHVALAEIMSVSRRRPEDMGLSVNTLPTVVFKSDYNLSESVPYLVRLKDSIYSLSNDTERRLLAFLNVAVYEVHEQPSRLLDKGVPYGGAAPVTLYILEDYHCPFCAALVRDLGGYMSSPVKQGRLKIVFVDLIVHPEVTEMHALTRCIYNVTGDAELYFNITRELYALFSQGTATDTNLTKTIASKYVSADVIEKAQACAASLGAKIQQEAQQLANEGFTATPTLVFWDNSTRRGLVVTGCLQVQPCMTQEQLDKILAWLEGGS